MPSGSSVVITYDGTDITRYVLFASATFEAQLNATPGTFEFTVKDVDQTFSFITGREVTLTVDGQLIYGGYLTMVSDKFAIPVDDTTAAHGGPEAVQTRQYVLRGVDYNILFDKRVLRNASNYLKQIPSFSPSRTIGDLIRNDLTQLYLDIPAGFDTTTFVDNIGTLPNTSGQTKLAWMQQGTTWRKQMEDFTQFNGARWYIDAEKNLHLHALDTSEARWGFSDVPNKRLVVPGTIYQGASYGFRELDATEDGSALVNDALVWGGSEWAGSGGTVFAREENAESEAEHNRWQMAETHFGEQGFGIQEGVDARATLIVNGSPSQQGDQLYGLKHPQWQFRFAWFAHDVPTLVSAKDHLVPGQLVTTTLYTFGDATHPLIQTLPLRQVRISFPMLDPDGFGYVRFDGFFGLQANDPWTLWRYLLKTTTRISNVVIATVDNSSESCLYGSFGNFYPEETPDGSTTVFHVKFGYIAGTTSVFLNGILQRGGADYFESDPESGEFTFFRAPASTDWIWVQCRCLAG